jgi:hypothetical protein
MTTHTYGSADSMDRNSGNPVVAKIPVSFKPRPVSSGMSTQQLIRNLEYNNQNVPFVSGAQLKIDEEKQAEIDAQKALAAVGTNFANTLKGLGSGSGAKAISASDQLARDKFNYDQNTALGRYQGLQDYSDNASYKPGFDSLRNLLKDNNRTGTQTINDTYDSRMGQIAEILRTGNAGVENVYDTGIANIDKGYDTASGTTSNAYNALDLYLKANQTNPYDNYQSSFTPSQNAMGSFLDAYGVSNDPVNQQVQAQNVSGQQGADAFAELNKVLGSIATQSNLSRLAESQFGRTGAATALSSQRAGYESNADMVRQNALQKLLETSQGQEFDAGNTQQDALNNLLTAINAGNLDIAQGEMKAGTDAEQAALAAYVPPAGTATKAPAAPAPQTAAPTFKAAVADLHPNFKGTLAEAKKEFPKLLKQYKK